MNKCERADKLVKKIMKNCMPTVFSLFMTGLYSVIDGLFIGRATGDSGLAAINIAWPISAVITAVGIGIGSGGSVLLSNYLGRDETVESENVYHNTVILMIIASIVITLLLTIIAPTFLGINTGSNIEVYTQAIQYSRVIILGCLFQLLGTGFIPLLRNMNLIVHAMVIMITGMIVNLISNYYLIFGLDLGIKGAAIGTITAQLVVCTLSIILIYVMKKKKARVVFNKKRTLKILKSGFSSFGVSLAPSLTLMITNMQCLKYGGEAAVACYATVSYIVFPVQSMLCGIGDGVQPLLSYYNGANGKKEIKEICKIAKILAVIIGAVALITVLIIKNNIPIWFGLSSTAIKYFKGAMIISAISFLIAGVVKFNSIFLYSTLRAKEAAILIYGEALIVSPILLMMLPWVFGINGIWISLSVTFVIMQLIYMIFFNDKRRRV